MALDRDTLTAIRQERTARLSTVPCGGFEYVTAQWLGAGPLVVSYTLQAPTPDDVRWLVVSQTAPLNLYQDPAGPQATNGVLWLTAETAGTARLLLFVEPND